MIQYNIEGLAVLLLDADLQVAYGNKAVQNYLPLYDVSLVGKHISTLSLPDSLLEQLTHVAQQGIATNIHVHTPSDQYSISIQPIELAQQTYLVALFGDSDTSHNQTLQERIGMMANVLQTQGVSLLEALVKQSKIDEDLAVQRDLFEKILSTMDEAILLVDDNGCIVMHNATAQQISDSITVGLSVRTWVDQHSFYVPFAHTTISDEQNPFLNALAGKEGKNWELYLTKRDTPNDKGIYLNVSVLPLSVPTFGDGTIIVMSDISNRKQSDIELLNSELTNKALLYAIPDILFRANKQGLYLQYLPAKDDVIPSAAFVNNKMADVLPPDVADEMQYYIEQALLSNEIQTFTFENIQQERINHYEARIAPINDNEVMGIVRDATNLIESEHAVRQTNENYRRLIELNPIPLAIIRQRGDIVFMNKACRRMLLIPDEFDLTGKSMNEYIHATHSLNFRSFIAQVMRGEYFDKPVSFKTNTFNKNYIRVEVNGSVITYNYELVIQLAMQDVTQQRKTTAIARKPKRTNADDIFSHTGCGIVSFDVQQALCIDCNHVFMSLMGAKSKEQVLATHLMSLSPEQQPDGTPSELKLKQYLEHYACSTEPLSIPWQYKNFKGELIDTQLYATPPAANNKYWIIVVRPV